MGRQLTLPSVPRRWTSRRTLKRVLIFSAGSLLLQPLLAFLAPNDHADIIHAEHPITRRIAEAAARWQKKISSQSETYAQFRTEYVRRYQIDPAPGLEDWFRIVKEDGHLMVDEYDEMMTSLAPFRLMGGDEVRRRTEELAGVPTFSILNVTHQHSFFSGSDYRDSGRAVSREDFGPGMERVEGLAAMLQRHIKYIPDGLIMAVSELAEPRVIVPWQDHPSTLAAFSSILDSPASAQTASSVAKMMSSLKQPNITDLLPSPNFLGDGSSWEIYARSCPPDSPSRKFHTSLKGDSAAPTHSKLVSPDQQPLSKRRWSHNALTAFQPSNDTNEMNEPAMPKRELRARSQPQSTVTPSALTRGKTEKNSESLFDSPAFSFVENGYNGLTHDALCHDPTLHQIQGAFYSDWRTLGSLYPVFSPSKIGGFSDILIPSNFYYGSSDRYAFNAENAIQWSDKENKLFWRGATTGGGNCPPRHQLSYQRHRFVRLTQSLSRSLQSLLVRSPDPSADDHQSLFHIKRPLGELNDNWMDIGFTSYAGCGERDICATTKDMFPLKDKVKFAEMSKYKAILDLDGMAFSGRFVGLMAMGSGVFKSTIYRDFASEWLEPWWHFVPLSPTYDELYNLLAYFLPLPKDIKVTIASTTTSILRRFGRNEASLGDAALEKIAKSAEEWSDLVANKPDIEAYVFRLALEWSRILNSQVDQGTIYKISDDSN